MVRIELSRRIEAPVERCFDLSRSITLHMASTDWTGERAVAGVTSGLIGLDEQVTWLGRHFGLTVTHTSRITGYQRPSYFQDCMVRGAFRRFCHDHYFAEQDGATVMKDVMEFEAPFGLIGRLVERLALDRHMRSLLERRNRKIQQAAEGDEWRRFLTGP